MSWSSEYDCEDGCRCSAFCYTPYSLVWLPCSASNRFGSTLPQIVGFDGGAERSSEAANWNLRFSTIELEGLRAYGFPCGKPQIPYAVRHTSISSLARRQNQSRASTFSSNR